MVFLKILLAGVLMVTGINLHAGGYLEDLHIIDWHVHVAGLGYGGSGCFINEKMRGSLRYQFYLRVMDVTEAELKTGGDRIIFKMLDEKIRGSTYIDQAVILALDGVIDGDGNVDKLRTQVYVPNDYVAEETARYDTLLFGASINPNRPDAIERLERAAFQGAVLIKWIPSIMDIDPADERFTAFYRRMAELNMPLLTHAGKERSFAEARDELADPLRLELPLKLGVTVIAAHIATTGKSGGQKNFERLLPLFDKYTNLYTDISSLTQINKLGYLVQALQRSRLIDRMLYGSDWPLQFFPLVSPWYHIRHISLQKAWRITGIKNQWDRDVLLKDAMGVPHSVFEKTPPGYLRRH